MRICFKDDKSKTQPVKPNGVTVPNKPVYLPENEKIKKNGGRI